MALRIYGRRRTLAVMVRYGDATPFIILGLYLSPVADARIRRTPGVRKLPYQYEGPIVDKSGAELPPLDTTYYFDQLIDHNNPSLGTFEQRYWHTWEFYESGAFEYVLLSCVEQ